MRVYKDKQFLVFDFDEDGKVKYDFAKKQAIGKSGKPVKDLKTQLRGLSIDDICNNCIDKQYGKFLRFVKKNYIFPIENIGTILDKVPMFAKFEQIFSAGFEDIVDKNFRYTVNDIPKALIKICKNHNIVLSNEFLKFYKEIPDAYILAYNGIDYISLTDEQLLQMFSSYRSVRIDRYEGGCRWKEVSYFNDLVLNYSYNAKSLLKYIDYLCTFEALENTKNVLHELYDYACMMSKISPKYDKYPRHFLTSHQIASRNYRRMQKVFDERAFKQRIDLSMEHSFDEYVFIYPKTTQDIKDEAAMQNNCVASYIQRVVDGDCHILFLRKKSEPSKSLCTIEVQNNEIVQAKMKFNNDLTPELQTIVDRWNQWRLKVAT